MKAEARRGASSAVDERPWLRIRSDSRWYHLELSDLWKFRDLLLILAWRDVKLRYRQTALGASWVVIQPLSGAGVFAFVFGKVAQLPTDGVPYFLFAYAGLLSWNVFDRTYTKVSGSLVNSAHLVSKTFFPRLILPFSTIFSALIDFTVALAVGGILLTTYGAPPLAVLLIPLWVLLILTLAVGIGLIAAAIAVTYRDALYITPFLMQMLLFASPVAYSSSAVPERFQTLYFLNPLASVVEAFRWSFLDTPTLHLGYVAYSASFAVCLLLVGAFAFKRMEERFADVI